MHTTINSEQHVRRLAARKGFRLHKLRGQDDAYWLLDNGTNGLIFGTAISRGVEVGHTLSDIAGWLDNETG